jgi:hypothetical protein
VWGGGFDARANGAEKFVNIIDKKAKEWLAHDFKRIFRLFRMK